jgi:hypothetical protein
MVVSECAWLFHQQAFKESMDIHKAWYKDHNTKTMLDTEIKV